MTLIDLAEQAARNENLDEMLVKAIVTVESSWNPKAVRYESHYKYLWFARGHAEKLMISMETEEVMQKCSWGLMQVMGAVAREFGFAGYCYELTDPEASLEYGCKLLKRLSQKYREEAEVIAAYNAGSARKTPGGLFVNQTYVDKVHHCLVKLRALV